MPHKVVCNLILADGCLGGNHNDANQQCYSANGYREGQWNVKQHCYNNTSSNRLSFGLHQRAHSDLLAAIDQVAPDGYFSYGYSQQTRRAAPVLAGVEQTGSNGHYLSRSMNQHARKAVVATKTMRPASAPVFARKISSSFGSESLLSSPTSEAVDLLRSQRQSIIDPVPAAAALYAPSADGPSVQVQSRSSLSRSNTFDLSRLSSSYSTTLRKVSSVMEMPPAAGASRNPPSIIWSRQVAETFSNINHAISNLHTAFFADDEKKRMWASKKLQSAARGFLTRRRLVKQWEQERLARVADMDSDDAGPDGEDGGSNAWAEKQEIRDHKIRLITRRRERRMIRFVTLAWLRIARARAPKRRQALARADRMAQLKVTRFVRDILSVWRDIALGPHSRKRLTTAYKLRMSRAGERIRLKKRSRGGGDSTAEAVAQEFYDECVEYMEGRRAHYAALSCIRSWHFFIVQMREDKKKMAKAEKHWGQRVGRAVMRGWHDVMMTAKEWEGPKWQERRAKIVDMRKHREGKMGMAFEGWREYAHRNAEATRRFKKKRLNWMRTVFNALKGRLKRELYVKRRMIERWIELKKEIMQVPLRAWYGYTVQRKLKLQAQRALLNAMARRRVRRRMAVALSAWVRYVDEGLSKDTTSEASAGASAGRRLSSAVASNARGSVSRPLQSLQHYSANDPEQVKALQDALQDAYAEISALKASLTGASGMPTPYERARQGSLASRSRAGSTVAADGMSSSKSFSRKPSAPNIEERSRRRPSLSPDRHNSTLGTTPSSAGDRRSSNTFGGNSSNNPSAGRGNSNFGTSPNPSAGRRNSNLGTSSPNVGSTPSTPTSTSAKSGRRSSTFAAAVDEHVSAPVERVRLPRQMSSRGPAASRRQSILSDGKSPPWTSTDTASMSESGEVVKLKSPVSSSVLKKSPSTSRRGSTLSRRSSVVVLEDAQRLVHSSSERMRRGVVPDDLSSSLKRRQSSSEKMRRTGVRPAEQEGTYRSRGQSDNRSGMRRTTSARSITSVSSSEIEGSDNVHLPKGSSSGGGGTLMPFLNIDNVSTEIPSENNNGNNNLQQPPSALVSPCLSPHSPLPRKVSVSFSSNTRSEEMHDQSKATEDDANFSDERKPTMSSNNIQPPPPPHVDCTRGLLSASTSLLRRQSIPVADSIISSDMDTSSSNRAQSSLVPKNAESGLSNVSKAVPQEVLVSETKQDKQPPRWSDFIEGISSYEASRAAVEAKNKPVDTGLQKKGSSRALFSGVTSSSIYVPS